MILASVLLAVTLLSELDAPAVRAPSAADVAAESAFATNAPAARASASKTVTITSLRADYDRREGVILFDGEVRAADPDFNMHADRMYVFVDEMNQLKRIVVVGNVAITNGLKSGSCETATYVRSLHRIVMQAGRDGVARLVDDDKKRSVVEGRRITFWTDSEQVEIDTPNVQLEGGLPAGAVQP